VKTDAIIARMAAARALAFRLGDWRLHPWPAASPSGRMRTAGRGPAVDRPPARLPDDGTPKSLIVAAP
jgi:hypothetical protein